MPLKVQASVDRESCEMFLSKQMPCVLCGVIVPANTWHRCEKTADTRKTKDQGQK